MQLLTEIKDAARRLGLVWVERVIDIHGTEFWSVIVYRPDYDAMVADVIGFWLGDHRHGAYTPLDLWPGIIHRVAQAHLEGENTDEVE